MKKIIHITGYDKMSDEQKQALYRMIVLAKEQMEYVDINGEKWKEKEKVNTRSSGMSRSLMALAESITVGEFSRKLGNINIVTEYALIQKKKSKLPKSKRDIVISRFLSCYEKVDTLT